MRAMSRLGGAVAAAVVGCAAVTAWAVNHIESPRDRAARAAAAAGPAPAPRFAPYVGVRAAHGYDMAAAVRHGVKDVTLAFVVAGHGCAPVWDGGVPLTDRALASRVAAVREAGGRVRVSFGGAEGTELAGACTGVRQLAAAYARVIDRYHVAAADFDLEGSAPGTGRHGDTAVRTRRTAAIARLQHDRPGLEVSFTLPVRPAGLTAEGTALLAEARDRRIDVSAVNVMAMHHDTAGTAHTGDMGRYAVRAATATQRQLRRVLGLSGPAAWKTLGVTPMIGVNDVKGGVFTLGDARRLARFAERKGIGRLSMWSAERDAPCASPPGDGPSERCSGVAQRPGAFAAALSAR